MEFKEFSFHPRVAAGISAAGYVSPTPIQEKAIPPVMEGRDVLGLAQTGTGKTAVFALPILHRLLEGERGRIRALIIAPTRELAQQIHEAIVILGRQTRLRSVSIYGGVSMNMQIQKLRKGADIIVACPGRLLDHMNQGLIDLSRLEVLVLDEADRMFDMGFLPDIRKIIKHVPVRRQTLLFSATMPDDIRKLSREILRDPVTIQVDPAAPARTVSHALYPVDQHLKTALLLELLRLTDAESVLIFTRTKHRARRVGQQLARAGYEAASLEGNLSQNKRQAALNGFRNGSFKVLVATDIAARGIDVLSISHVINYDIPDTMDAYTHRVGRTGRAEKTGDAFTFITEEDEDVAKSIEYVLGRKLERRRLKGFNYDKSASPRELRLPGESRGYRKDSGRPSPAVSNREKGNGMNTQTKSSPDSASSRPSPPRSSAAKRRFRPSTRVCDR
jgi:ATP-dependent RNA helicase RhlE